MKYTIFMFTLYSVLSVFSANAQTLKRIGDINPGAGNSIYDEENVVIAYKGKFIFTANDGQVGYEVWISDGDTTELLKDIYTGPGSSKPQNYYLMGGKVLFTAQDSAHGVEWWSTDGTPGGTQLVRDIFPGIYPGVRTGSNSRKLFGVLNGNLYFSGANRSDDYELWKTNGTYEGTVLVKNITPDGFGNFSSYPEDYAAHKGFLYFTCREGFWRTNGTAGGTTLVEDEDPEDVFGLEPQDLISNGAYIFFIQNGDLWRSDGSAAGTIKIKDMGDVGLNWFGNRFAVLGDNILFPASDPTHGDELWRSDGTPEGTYMVIDLDPGFDGYAPQNQVVFKDKLYYKGDNGSTGIEFWSSDGTPEGTTLVKDISPGSSSGFYLPTEIYTNGNFIVMNAGAAFEKELWISDGTTNGTVKMDINPNGQSNPSSFHAMGDTIFFFATTPEFGSEPYILDMSTTSSKEIPLAIPVKLFPNPSNGLVYMHSESQTTLQHSLIDMNGKLIIPPFTGDMIDLSPYPAGVYFLKSTSKSSGEFTFNKLVRME